MEKTAADVQNLMDCIPPKAIKRTARMLSPCEKLKAVERIRGGETKASISRQIGVPESTLRGWCKNEQKLRETCNQINSCNLIYSGVENYESKRSKLYPQTQALHYQNLIPNGVNGDINTNALNLNGIYTNFNSYGSDSSVGSDLGNSFMNNFSQFRGGSMPNVSAVFNSEAGPDGFMNYMQPIEEHSHNQFKLDQVSCLPYDLASIFTPSEESQGDKQAFLVEWWQVFYTNLSLLGSTIYTRQVNDSMQPGDEQMQLDVKGKDKTSNNNQEIEVGHISPESFTGIFQNNEEENN